MTGKTAQVQGTSAKAGGGLERQEIALFEWAGTAAPVRTVNDSPVLFGLEEMTVTAN